MRLHNEAILGGRYRALVLATIALGWIFGAGAFGGGVFGGGEALAAPTTPKGGFRSFCVGQCDPPPFPSLIPIGQPATSPFGFSFSILLDDVTFPDNTGFAFLDLLDEQGEELLRIKVMQLPEGGDGRLSLSLEYRITGSLFGSMSLGEAVEGEDCIWVERTEMSLSSIPPSPGILVARSGTGEVFTLGPSPLSGSPFTIRQGVWETVGEPSGWVHISDAEIGERCTL